MKRRGITGERIFALFLLGTIAFNAPILSIFNNSTVVFGIPLLYVYLFTAWLALIALMALSARRRHGAELAWPPRRPRAGDRGDEGGI